MNQLDLKGRVAIVTGAARGIGHATAERILRSGGSVALWDRDKARLADAHDDLSAFGSVAFSAVELTADDAVQSALHETLMRFGKVDILVNNAGVTGGNAATWDLDPRLWR